MSECEQGQKPIVKYKFGEGGFRQFKTDIAPIDIVAKTYPIPNTENYGNQGYQIRFYSPNNFATLEYTVLDYKLKMIPSELGYGVNDRELIVIQCDQTTFPETGVACDITTIVKDVNIKCLSATKNRCSIQLFDTTSGKLIFQDQGDCPIEFKVQCGNCPDDSIECKTSGYPGYCCIPCNELKNEILGIQNTVKNINNG